MTVYVSGNFGHKKRTLPDIREGLNEYVDILNVCVDDRLLSVYNILDLFGRQVKFFSQRLKFDPVKQTPAQNLPVALRVYPLTDYMLYLRP